MDKNEIKEYAKKHATKDSHVGTMRFDFNDGETALANRWSPYQTLSQEDIAEIQPKVNEVMFDRFNSFTSILNECNGRGYNNEKTFYEETKSFVYGIKLIPVKGDYNGYIFVYRKVKKED